MVSKTLKDFILNFAGRNGIFIDETRLIPQTDLCKDLGIDDLDFDKFITEFITQFDIAHSSFDARSYFGIGIPLIDNNVKIIKKIIGNRPWLPVEKEKRKPFTLEVLENALKHQKLV